MTKPPETLAEQMTLHGPKSFDAPPVRSLLYVVAEDGVSFKPLSAGELGGGGGGSDPSGAKDATLRNKGIATHVYPPRSMTITDTAEYLTLPPDAPFNVTASVHVISGSVRWSLGGVPSASTPLLNAGDSADLTGAELAAFQMMRDGGTDALVYVTYGVVG